MHRKNFFQKVVFQKKVSFLKNRASFPCMLQQGFLLTDKRMIILCFNQSLFTYVSHLSSELGQMLRYHQTWKIGGLFVIDIPVKVVKPWNEQNKIRLLNCSCIAK